LLILMDSDFLNISSSPSVMSHTLSKSIERSCSSSWWLKTSLNSPMSCPTSSYFGTAYFETKIL
jgi:hypothetical protein